MVERKRLRQEKNTTISNRKTEIIQVQCIDVNSLIEVEIARTRSRCRTTANQFKKNRDSTSAGNKGEEREGTC